MHVGRARLLCDAILGLGAVWGLLGLALSLLDSRARVTVRVRGWLTFLAGVVQLWACTCPGSVWAWWVGGYLFVMFMVGVGYSIVRGLRGSGGEPAVAALWPAGLAAALQVCAASWLSRAHFAQLLPLVWLWLGLALFTLRLPALQFGPLMLWLRLVSVESLGVFCLLVVSWVNPLILWLLGGPLDYPSPDLLYAYLCLTFTSWTLRWSLSRLSSACGFTGL